MMKKSAKTVICTLFAAILSLPMAAQGDWKRETEKAVSNLRATQNAASDAPAVPVPRPLQSVSERNEISL